MEISRVVFVYPVSFITADALKYGEKSGQVSLA
jgi:hypothetical protein